MLIVAVFVGGVLFGAGIMAYWSLIACVDFVEDRERMYRDMLDDMEEKYRAELGETQRQLDEARQVHLWN